MLLRRFASIPAAASLSIALLVGCSSVGEMPGDEAALGDAARDDGVTASCQARVTVTPAAPILELASKVDFAIDLQLDDDGGSSAPHPIEVVLSKAGAPVKKLHDGLAPLGKLAVKLSPTDAAALAIGAYTIEARLGCPAEAAAQKPATATAQLFAARLGAVRVDLGAGDGARVPLMYHAVNRVPGNAFPITEALAASSVEAPDGEPELDDAAGQPRRFPGPWSDLASPKVDSMGAVVEDGVAYPVSFKVASRPDVTFTFGKTARGNVPNLPAGAPAVRLVLEGAPPSAIVGDTVKVRLDKSPVPAVDRVDLALKWRFEAQTADGFRPIPGATQEATVRLYGVLGNAQGSAAPNLPWVAVVDAATAKVAGKTADPAEVRKTLVQLVYEELGLRYDRKNGQSFYTTYTSSYVGARFDLGAFLLRSRGSIVNCTDCASILSTYANMVGVKLHYAIVGFSFSLNPIMGIGSTTFGSPFDSGRLAFNYHAVTTPDATKTIDDATLALDGDVDPKAAPQSKLLVQDVNGSEYLTRLSPGTPEYKYVDEATTVR